MAQPATQLLLAPSHRSSTGSLALPSEERWLDALATGLSEHGWLSSDASPLIGHDLLVSLWEEVQILDRGDALQSARIGRGQDKVRDRSVRRDKIAWLQGQAAAQSGLFAAFESIRNGLNQRLFLGLKRFEAHYATYHEGDFYRRHVDSFRGRASRIVSVVVYLNPEWEPADGGALQVFNRDSESEICGLVSPCLGNIAVFMSEEIPHEVLPANRTRYSVACWFRQDEVPLRL